MKKVAATITTAYELKNPDQAPRIEEIGYNPEKAKIYALQALKYECFTDFTSPYACATGHTAECFKAEGVELEKEENEDDIVQKLGWEYAITLRYNRKTYAFAPDFDEWREGVRITSDEIKKAGKFPD